MSDVDGGAVAPAEAVAAPAPEAEIIQPPNPISTEPRAKEPEPALKEPISARDAIRKATEKVEAQTKADAEKPGDKAADKKEPVKAEAKDKAAKPAEPAKKDDASPTRDETGKFASKTPQDDAQKAQEGQKATEGDKGASDDDGPPARFTPEAKAAWKDAPEPVRKEVQRAIANLTQGVEKHREAAQEFEAVREYHSLAKEHGTNLKAALDNYVGIERLIRQDPVAGFERVASNLGIPLKEIAEKVLGRTPEQHSEAHASQLREANSKSEHFHKVATDLFTEVKMLREQVTQYQTKEIDSFKSGNERFEELLPEMIKLVNSGMANDLPEAYRKASILNPSAEKPAPIPAPDIPAKELSDPAAQTLKGSKSITGSPSPGSSPPVRPQSSSIKESIRRARALAGA